MRTGMMVGAIYCNGYQEPDHQQLTLLNWDTKSVLALNIKTESESETVLLSQLSKVYCT